MSTKTKAPTGLKVSRNGRKFKFEWTQKADYDKQQIAYSYNTANAFAAGMWADIGKNAKSYTITLPSLDKGLTKFVFKVRGKVNNKDWSSATSINVISKLKAPHTPSASMALTSKYSSTFSWTTDTKPTDMRPFDHVVRQTKLIQDCPVNTSNGFEKLTGWTTDGDDLGANGSKPYSETTAVVAGKSYTRVVRVKAVGAYGSSKWDYAWHVYADPYAATNLVATATKDLDKNIFTGYATWTGKKNAAHPIDKVIPQYVMAVPDEGMQCPDVSFNNLPEQKDTSDDATAFVIDSLLAKDQCLFFRILHKRDGDNRDVPSLPVLVGKDGTGFLKDPIFTQAPDKQATSARVYAENKSEVPDSFLVITYQDDNYEEYDIGIITGDNEYTDVIYPANPSNPKFGVYAVVATATYEEREDGGDQYEISNVRMRSENTLHETGTIVKVPQNLRLTQTTKNALLVEWDWIWDGIEGIEISWSENEEAWESNEEPEVHNVKKINPNRLYLLGLDTGKRWYVRARFIKSEADESYGNYTETKWLDLVTAPAIPELELSNATVKKGGEFTASWVYVSTDGQEQKAAVIYEVPENAVSEDDYIKVAEAGQEQSIVISTTNNPVASTWSTGTTHNLVVRVISESDKPSEFSNSEPIAIAEPVECEIEDTNLVEDSVPVNPEEYSGNPITFDTGEQEKEVTSLHVDLLPVQEGSGTPSPQNIRPITGRTQTDVVDSNGTDTTTTTVTLPHTVYGADVDVTGGESKETWQNIASYNGETISEPWLSSMDEYVSGATPTTGAQVTYKLATPTDLQTTPTDVELLTGVNNISADGDMELTIADMIESGYYLKELPLEVTVTGAGNSGETTLVVERAEDFKEDAPDEATHLGFDGEAVYHNVYGGEEQQIITSNDLISKFDDGCSYRIRASVKDGLGQTNKDYVDFTVRWEKQASEPTIEAEVVGDTAHITVTKSASANEDDYCNIYRLSAGKPELIVEHGSFFDDTSEATEKATTYVDPYPTIGDYGYRAVLYTANGDYIIDATAEHGKKMAYSDAELTYESSAKTLIDFGDDRVALNKNVDVSNTWSKDFQQTKYLGGSVTGDWNVGVLRNSSVSAVAVTLVDMDEINSMSRLAEYVGECHIRTNSGDNFHADIQVSDNNSHDKAGFVRSYSMSLNKIDAQTLDGLTLEEWEGRNAVE